MSVTSLWVDTDFGFDDLWALLLLRKLGVDIAGVSLVCGNTSLDQVLKNAGSAQQFFDLNLSLYAGASQPVAVPLQSAEAVLGPTGMRSRGKTLPETGGCLEASTADEAFCAWLKGAAQDRREVLALAPLTNLAWFFKYDPEAFSTIDKITWMGGSCKRGNQTTHAEFNAYADPEALDIVLSSGVSLDIVDLELCRQVAFGEEHLSKPSGEVGLQQSLLDDLLAGYLDIALERDRLVMNIYDPVAALVFSGVVAVQFSNVDVTVRLSRDQQRGRTVFTPDPSSTVRLANRIDGDEARDLCLQALQSPFLR